MQDSADASIRRNGRRQPDTYQVWLAMALVRGILESVVAPVAEPMARGGLAPYQLRRVTDRMLEDLSADVPLSELTALAGLSPSHFCHAFKVSTGLTPRAWLRTRRAERAAELLRTSELTLADIALQCGFADQPHFSRVFALEFGAPPGAWRRTNRD